MVKIAMEVVAANVAQAGGTPGGAPSQRVLSVSLMPLAPAEGQPASLTTAGPFTFTCAFTDENLTAYRVGNAVSLSV